MNGASWRSVRAAVALYRAATLLLGASFRARGADEMVACFGAIAADARVRGGRRAVVAVTAASLGDLLVRAFTRGRAPAREQARTAIWQGAWLDVRHAARRLVRRPAFALTSILTLGLGLAAAASVFSLVHGVVLRPLPYPESDRIVDVDHSAADFEAMRGGLGITFGFYRYYAERLRSIEALAMYSDLELPLTGAGDPVRLDGLRVTPSLFDVLRVPPQIGRWFTADEGRPGAARTVVLSHRLWRERFGASTTVIGRTIDLGGVRHEVVGVMPRTFAFPTNDVSFWIPRVVPATGIGGWNERAVGRLAPGADSKRVQDEIISLYPLLRSTTDDPGRVRGYLDDAGIKPVVRPLKERVVGDVRATLWVLLGTVGFVLLVAIANVANLFLVRAGESQRELSVRHALGASTGRLVRTTLAESLLLASAAGTVAVGATAAAIGALRAAAPANVPRLEEVGLTPAVAAVTIGLTLMAGLLVGTLPALGRRISFGDDARRSSTAGRNALRGRHVLMAAQVALALVLLIGSGLLFRSYQALRAVDLGFTARQALVFEVGLPGTRYPERVQAKAFHDLLLERLRGIPGVTAAGAVARCLPLVGNMCWGVVLEAEGRPNPSGQLPPVTGARLATPDYFSALGIPVRGRVFTRADERGAATVAILSEAAANAYFPGEDPIGRRIRFDSSTDRWHTIVGVAGNVRAKVDTDEFTRTIYLPVLTQGADGPPPDFMSYVLRTSVPPASISAAVRQAVAAQDPAIPVAALESLQGLIDRETAPAAFALTIVGLAASIALLLGVVGVYAVVTYAVSLRTREMGVRLALGARPADLSRMVLRQGGLVVIGGAAAGLGGALLLTRLMEAMLYGVTATDPVSFAALTAVLLLVAGGALWLPARRAARVDPVRALRAE